MFEIFDFTQAVVYAFNNKTDLFNLFISPASSERITLLASSCDFGISTSPEEISLICSFAACIASFAASIAASLSIPPPPLFLSSNFRGSFKSFIILSNLVLINSNAFFFLLKLWLISYFLIKSSISAFFLISVSRSLLSLSLYILFL